MPVLATVRLLLVLHVLEWVILVVTRLKVKHFWPQILSIIVCTAPAD
jgi:hypothetical protein